MPAYDYTCTRCGHLTEVIHGIYQPGPATCPNCGAVGTMRKGFTAPAVHFKGSGWAKKDRSTSSSALTKAKAAAEGGSSGSGGEGSSSDGAKGSGDGSKGSGDGSKGSSGEGSSKASSGESSSEKKDSSAGSGSWAARSGSSDGGD